MIEERDQQLREEIKAVVRVANQREEWWKTNVTAMTSSTQQQFDQKEALMSRASAGWQSQDSALNSAALGAAQQAKLYQQEVSALQQRLTAIDYQASTEIREMNSEAQASAARNVSLETALQHSEHQTECRKWEQEGTINEAAQMNIRYNEMTEQIRLANDRTMHAEAINTSLQSEMERLRHQPEIGKVKDE